MSATSTMTVRLPEELKERLDRLAESTERSKSWLAADAIAGYVEANEWQVGEIERGIRDADTGDFASPEEIVTVFAKWSNAP